MQNLLEREQVKLDIVIEETMISCEYGELEYSIDGDYASVNAISVYRTREGIGTQLVDQFESLIKENKIKLVEVPCSPTKEAVLFWMSLGYEPTTKEDKKWANKISRSYRENGWKIPSGVVIMSKKLK
ncbi:MAG: GNAT family N-acetyltransferase [Leptospiraceae bacterium]|nr:GNAT family N-acetyltransferase [Leptospiraceae bacterium]